jgi:branched-chain amino acid transport system ATP-binding protein
MAILEIQEVSSGYGEVQILWGASLELQEGKLTSLVGGNGVGKTTLLRSVMGLVKPWKGSIRFDGQDVSHLPPYAKAEMGLVLVPEGRQLFTDMSVAENLEMGATPKHARPNLDKNMQRVFEMFPRLQERRNQKAGTLSGGEQQMLAVGRGIMADPKVLMIDELSLGLAPVLVLEQNVQMALAVSDYAYVLAQGKIEMEGASRELAQNPHVRAAYLGL